MQRAAVRRVGLIGHPVGHSISPVFQQAAFDALALPACYELWDTPEEALAERVAALRREPFLGANVTVPHKQAVMPLLDEISGEATLSGAVNCIAQLPTGLLAGHNTDVGGFRRALSEDLGISVAGMAVAVLGAGGAARAVVAALARNRAASVTILNRSPQRAASLAADLAGGLNLRLEGGPLDRDVARRLAGCGLVVNCTSVGLAGSGTEAAVPLAIDALPAGAAVVDIIANPVQTVFLRAAAAAGHPVMGGLSMLVHQGALAFELWTGRAAPLDVMMIAARRAMGLAAGAGAPATGKTP